MEVELSDLYCLRTAAKRWAAHEREEADRLPEALKELVAPKALKELVALHRNAADKIEQVAARTNEHLFAEPEEVNV